MQEKDSLGSSEALCVSVPAAGRLLGISRGTAYSMARSGQLKTIRCGVRRLVVPMPWLRRMLEGRGDDGSHPAEK